MRKQEGGERSLLIAVATGNLGRRMFLTDSGELIERGNDNILACAGTFSEVKGAF